MAEEETESCISGPYGQLQRIPCSEASVSDIDDIYGKSKGLKKKPGLLRGLGSMFRFGRHRKSTTGAGNAGLSASAVRKQQAALEKQEREEYEEAEKEKARQAAQAEQNRIQEQYRRLVERQKTEPGNPQQQQQQQQQHAGNYGITVSIGSRNPGGSRSVDRKLGPGQMQFRKSMENHAIREREREREEQHHRDVNGNHFQNPNHLRSASYDVYNEMTRPGSRVGFADPKKYSHYINYEEIRHHLK